MNAPKNQNSSSKKMSSMFLDIVVDQLFASYRILDISDNFITFFYQRHGDDFFVVENFSIFDFIKHIILHILDKQFKTIHYYGFYNKKHKFHSKIVTMIDSIKIPLFHSLTKFRLLMIKSFDFDHLTCIKYGSFMEFQKLIC